MCNCQKTGCHEVEGVRVKLCFNNIYRKIGVLIIARQNTASEAFKKCGNKVNDLGREQGGMRGVEGVMVRPTSSLLISVVTKIIQTFHF